MVDVHVELWASIRALACSGLNLLTKSSDILFLLNKLLTLSARVPTIASAKFLAGIACSCSSVTDSMFGFSKRDLICSFERDLIWSVVILLISIFDKSLGRVDEAEGSWGLLVASLPKDISNVDAFSAAFAWDLAAAWSRAAALASVWASDVGSSNLNVGVLSVLCSGVWEGVFGSDEESVGVCCACWAVFWASASCWVFSSSASCWAFFASAAFCASASLWASPSWVLTGSWVRSTSPSEKSVKLLVSKISIKKFNLWKSFISYFLFKKTICFYFFIN